MARLQALLVYLLLHRQAPQPRQHIAFQFWPDSSEKQAHTNLRKLLFQLRNVLPDPDRFLVQDHLTVHWRPDAPYTLDVAEMQSALTHCFTRDGKPLAHATLDDLRNVVNLYQGELLPGCFDEWLLPLRQQLQRHVMAALEQLTTVLETQRAYSAGIAYARRLLTFDPLEEKSYQRLIRLHTLDGDYAAATRVYHDCVAILQAELDLPPNAETLALYERLRQRTAPAIVKAETEVAAAERIPLVGRQAEWQTLQNAWQQPQPGQAHFVCLWGEAGIGKTRLAEELLDWAGHHGILTARARSYQAHGALAYAPITELLRTPTLTARLGKLGGDWLSEVARLLPELLAPPSSVPPPQPMTHSWQRQRFVEGLVRALLVDEQPLLLLLDDLHWCDQETLAWLNHLLHFSQPARLLVVGTSRIEEVDSAHPLTSLCFGLRREALVTEIELTPLSTADTATLADAVGRQHFTAAQRQQIFVETAGNPLFVVESVRATVEASLPSAANGLGAASVATVNSQQRFLPPRVYAVMQARLNQLSASAQKIAALAAVIGRACSFALLMAAAHLDEDSLIDSVEELSRRRILREHGATDYDFTHDRLRDVAYAELSQARRRQLHRYVAEALESVYAHQLNEQSALLAGQWEQAGQRDKAVTYLQRAGDYAAAQYLHADATRYLNQALDLTPPENQEKICQLLLARERAHAIQGERAEQEKDLDLLQAVIPAWVGEPRQVLILRAEIAIRWSRYERTRANLPRAADYARQAVDLAQQGNALQQQADAFLEWGQSLWSKADFVGARVQWNHALQTAEAAHLPSRLAESLERLAQIDMFTGGSATGIMHYLERALVNYEQEGNLIGTCNILNKLGFLPVAQGAGDYTQARWHYERGLALSRKIGARWNECVILRNLGILAVCEGDYTRAERTMATARQLDEQLGAQDELAIGLNCLGFLYFNRGQLTQAQRMQEQALQQLRQQRFVQWELKALTSLGWIHLLSGNFSGALAYATEGRAAALAVNDQRQAAYASTCLGHSLIELQQYAEATAAFQQAVSWHEQMEQANRRLEPLAGLARVALLQGDLAQGQRIVEVILTHLQSHTLDRTEDAFRVYHTCYHLLRATGDGRAHAMLHTAYEQLQTRALTIADPAARRHFWEAIPGHKEIERLLLAIG
jgi:DNA-binding SARP family transcriptional activator